MNHSLGSKVLPRQKTAFQCVILCFVLAWAAEARAQGPGVATSRLDAEASGDSRDRGFEVWRISPAAQAHVAPVVLNTADHRIIIESALTRASHRDAGFSAALAACSDSLRVTPEVRQTLLDSRPFRAAEALLAREPRISITILPQVRGTIDCARTDGARLSLLAAGILVAEDTTRNSSADISYLRVIVGSQMLAAAVQLKEPALTLHRNGVSLVRDRNAYRLLLRYDDLVAEGPTDRDRRLVLELVGSSGRVTPIDFPGDLVAALRAELLPWRIQRLAAAAERVRPIPLPAPKDAALRDARASYAGGAFVDATGVVMERLARRGLSSGDVTTAAMQAGLTFLAHGDSASARLMLRRALSEEPCLQLPPSEGPELRALVDGLRPRQNCEMIPTGTVLRLSLVPGRYRRFRHPDRPPNPTHAIALGTAAALSVAAHLQSKAAYDDYLEAVTDAQIRSRYDAASAARGAGNVMAGVFWGLYLTPIARAVIEESRFARRYHAVTNYGAQSPPRVSLYVGPSGVGVQLPLF